MSDKYYQNNARFLIAVDCIILGFREKELHLLLTRRPVEPMKNEWSLMGGFMEENESLTQAAEKVLYRYTQTEKYLYGTGGSVRRSQP